MTDLHPMASLGLYATTKESLPRAFRPIKCVCGLRNGNRLAYGFLSKRGRQGHRVYNSAAPNLFMPKAPSSSHRCPRPDGSEAA